MRFLTLPVSIYRISIPDQIAETRLRAYGSEGHGDLATAAALCIEKRVEPPAGGRSR